MSGQTIILVGESQRAFAKTLIDRAPPNAVVNIKAPRRTLDQNAKMWAMLSDVSRARPEGRIHTTDVWKVLFMQALGHQVEIVEGLDGTPLPIGFSTSHLTKEQMSDLIELIYEYGARQGVHWTEPQEPR